MAAHSHIHPGTPNHSCTLHPALARHGAVNGGGAARSCTLLHSLFLAEVRGQ